MNGNSAGQLKGVIDMGKFHIYVKPQGQLFATKVKDTKQTRDGFATKADAENYLKATKRSGNSNYTIK